MGQASRNLCGVGVKFFSGFLLSQSSFRWWISSDKAGGYRCGYGLNLMAPPSSRLDQLLELELVMLTIHSYLRKVSYGSIRAWVDIKCIDQSSDPQRANVGYNDIGFKAIWEGSTMKYLLKVSEYTTPYRWWKELNIDLFKTATLMEVRSFLIITLIKE